MIRGMGLAPEKKTVLFGLMIRYGSLSVLLSGCMVPPNRLDVHYCNMIFQTYKNRIYEHRKVYYCFILPSGKAKMSILNDAAALNE